MKNTISKALYSLELAYLAGEIDKDTLEKSRTTKYFKREGSPGNYKYYYTKEQYEKEKGKGESNPTEKFESKVQVLVSNPPENFYDKVAEHFGEPEDDGESEGALIERIMSHPKEKVSKFIGDLELDKPSDIKVGQTYHSNVPGGGGEAIDFTITSIKDGKYQIETYNNEGRKGEHTFDEKTIKELVSESKLKSNKKILKSEYSTHLNNLLGNTEDDIQKSDVYEAYIYADKQMTFSKKGSEVKPKLNSKLQSYVQKHSDMKTLMSNLETKIKDSGVEITGRDEYGYAIFKAPENGLKIRNKDIWHYDDLKWKCRGIINDIKALKVLSENLEDNKSYTFTLKQLMSFE